MKKRATLLKDIWTTRTRVSDPPTPKTGDVAVKVRCGGSRDRGCDIPRKGWPPKLKLLAAEIPTSFEARGINREALASFLLFQQVCSEERATLEIARRLGTLLRRTRPDLS